MFGRLRSDPGAPFGERLFARSPLRLRPFRRYYCGSLAVAMGYTVQATVAAWLMATLTTSTLMVALVQTASTLPTLLFGLAAGALADIVDRKKIVQVTLLLLIGDVCEDRKSTRLNSSHSQ